MTKPLLRAVALAALISAASPAVSVAQAPSHAPDAGVGPDTSAASTSAWSFRAAAATYFLPDDDNYVQPTVAADRKALHLESRYNYEDRNSLSGFVGWNLGAGSTVRFEVTPMIGGVAGDTNGVIPAAEGTVTFGPVEVYSEGEYVIDVDHRSNRFFYNWSEFSIWATDWLRVGLATQRTRTFHLRRASEREVERGVLAGVSVGRIEGAVYVFNPGATDAYVVASVGVSF